MSSCNQDFNLSRIERYLALVLETEATPVGVLTKADLCDDPLALCREASALHPEFVVEAIDARDATQSKVLDHWCGPGKTIAVVGSSGVGKSTLINTMGGHGITTSGIRESDGKGRHTTTARSLHRLNAGGWLIDNPGMRELQIADCERGVEELFEDVLEIARRCRYRNCNHQGDDGCAFAAALESGEIGRSTVWQLHEVASRRGAELCVACGTTRA